jgi:hypothetical protein
MARPRRVRCTIRRARFSFIDFIRMALSCSPWIPDQTAMRTSLLSRSVADFVDRKSVHLQRALVLLSLFLASSCATRTPLSTPVPFVVHGRVITRAGQPVAHAHVELSEEHSRLFPLAIARPRELDNGITHTHGSFAIRVTTPLQIERLYLFIISRTYDLVGSKQANKYNETNDSVYTNWVRVAGPNIIRVHSGFIPGPAHVKVQKLPRF